MARGKKQTELQANADMRAQAIKKALRDSAREVATSRAAKEKMAKFAGLSVSAIEQFIYEGKGSAGTFINVFMFLFGIDEKTILGNLKQSADVIRRQKPQRKSDSIWFDLDREMTEEEKIYWLNIIRHAVRLKNT